MNVTASWGKILAAVFVVMLVCAGQCPAEEFRGFWVDAWGPGIQSQAQVDDLLGVVGDPNSKGQIRDANCNAIVVQVRRNCDANYPSSMGEPYMGGLSPANFNGLQAAINAAHDTTGGKQRIEVHAWIVTFRTSGLAVYALHDDTPTGSLTTLDNYWPSRDDAGAEVADKAFDPGHPLAEQYTVNVAMDLVNNFDIDGIHFDYVRFTANDQGYNPTSIARYNAHYGLSGQPGPADEQFKQWRRDQVSSVVRQVYAKTLASKPLVKVSGSFVTWNPSPVASTRAAFQGTRPYYDVYSDWDSWMQEGIVDAAIPMTYYNWASLPTDYTKWMNFEKDRHGNRHMYIGPGIYLNSLDNAILELQKTRDPSPVGNYADGFCGYSCRTPYISGSWAGFAPTFTPQVTPTPDTVPVMPWKTSPTKGHISGTVTYATGGAWADGAMVTLTGPMNRSMYVDGMGFYAFIDLTPGAYTVTVSKQGYPNSVRTVNVAIGSVTGNIYKDTDLALGESCAPAITNVHSGSVVDTSATIMWNTDVPTDSQVRYGLTTNYGMTTPLDTTMVTSHVVQLTGLTPRTTHHYQVVSSGATGCPGVSGDYSFTTCGPPIMTNLTVTGITAHTAIVTWNTDEPSDTRVDYGLTSSYGSQQSNPALVTSHSITLTGLTAGTTYHYRTLSTGSCGTKITGDYTFATTSCTPVISSAVATSITGTSATITWTTEDPADSRVDYGPTTAYGSQQVNAAQVTSHSVTLTGLSPRSTYHYRCSSTNTCGTGSSVDYTFVTVGPPIISSINATSIQATSATITWTTEATSDSTVNYGLTSSYGSQATNASQVTSHSITLTGLTTTTIYHYQCVSTNANGTTTTTDFTFTTAGPPTITNVASSGITASSATITWTTNQAADSKVNYGTTTSYGSQATNLSLVTSHTITLTSLTPSTTYHYQCVSVNANGTATSDDYTFATSAPPMDIIIDDPLATHSGSGTWTPVTGTAGVGYDNSYHWILNRRTSSGSICTWTPTIVTAGNYDVWCIYPPITGTPTATANATFTVTYNGGTASASFNQANNTNVWQLIATNRPFAAGTSGNVVLSNITGENNGTKRVVADAVKFVYVFVDTVPPTISIGAPSGTLTRSGPITYSINYSDNVGVTAVTLASPNVTLNKTGTANGTVAVTGSGNAIRTVTISSITGTGTLGISIAAGTASDAASNLALAAGPSTTFTVDNTAPTISIGAPSVAQTNSGPITYTINYGGASVVTLANGNITLNKTGTADGTIAVTGSGTATRTVTISDITGTGTLGISVAAATATDTAGNSDPAAGPSTTFSVDNTAPTISIGALSATLTKSGPITYTITYGGADTVTLANGDVTLNTTGTANGAVAVTGSDTATRTVTISSITGTGTLGISVVALTARDTAGNNAPAAGPSTTFTVDNTSPVINSVSVTPPMAAVGDAIHVAVDATDNVDVASVTANGTALANPTGSTWGGDILALDTLVVHNVTIVATDATGNSATNTSATYTTAQVIAARSAAAWQPVMYSVRGLYLFKFSGRVAVIDDDHFTLSDGSALPVTVHAPGYQAKVRTGDYASARGILDVSGSIESELGLITKY